MPESFVEIVRSPYCYDEGQCELLDDTEARVREMRAHGRLSPQALEKIRRYFRIKNIYNSTAIEGNLLDVGETRQVVELGLTLTGKPLKDQAEAKNLAAALEMLEVLASSVEEPIRERDIRELHALVLKGIDDANAGSYRSAAVEISGSDYKPCPPESIPAQMNELAKWLGEFSVPSKNQSLSGLLVAAATHAWFVTVHPFIDGNGRVGRLLMNLLLMRYGYPIAIITKDDRLRYYDALEQSQSSDLSGLIALLSECVEESLEEYEQAVTEQAEQEEWARTVAGRLTRQERVRAGNEYELWKSAMDLLKSYFRQTTEILDESATFGRVYFKDFGTLEFEKYASLRQGQSAKRTWFFRVDFRSGEVAARYLFFFGAPSHALRQECDVTAHVSREESSYHYVRLDHLTAPNVPDLREIGYLPGEERFVALYGGGALKRDRVESIGKQFIEQVVSMHFTG
jgi:Fic family protein